MKYQDIPTMLLEEEFNLRKKKEHLPEEIQRHMASVPNKEELSLPELQEKYQDTSMKQVFGKDAVDQTGDINELYDEIMKRKDYYQELPEWMKMEVPAAIMGYGSGLSSEMMDELMGTLGGDDLKKKYRDYNFMLKENYPKVHAVGDIAGGITQAMLLKKIGGPAIEKIPGLNKAKGFLDGIIKTGAMADSTVGQKAMSLLAETGLNATHGGAMAMLSGIGLGHNPQQRLANARNMGMYGLGLGGIFSLAGNRIAREIIKQEGVKGIAGLAKALGVEDSAHVQKFLTRIASTGAEREKFLGYLAKSGVDTKNSNPVKVMEQIENHTKDLIENRNKDTLEVIKKNNEAKAAGSVGANGQMEFDFSKGGGDLPFTKEKIHDLYGKRMGIMNDETQYQVDSYWRSKFGKDWDVKGKKFNIDPMDFAEIDSNINKTSPNIHKLGFMNMTYEGKEKDIIKKQIKKAGDNILKNFGDVFTPEEISKFTPEQAKALKQKIPYFKEFYHAYNDSDSNINKLINLKDVMEEINTEKLSNTFKEAEKQSTKQAIGGAMGRFGVGGLGVGLAAKAGGVGAMGPAILGGMALAGAPALMKGAIKALPAGSDLLMKSPYIGQLAATATKYLTDENLTEEDRKLLREYEKKPQEQKTLERLKQMKARGEDIGDLLD